MLEDDGLRVERNGCFLVVISPVELILILFGFCSSAKSNGINETNASNGSGEGGYDNAIKVPDNSPSKYNFVLLKDIPILIFFNLIKA